MKTTFQYGMNGLMKMANLDQFMDTNGEIGKEKMEKKHDQITKLIDDIKSNPNSRRLLVSSWNVSEIDKMALAPCHTFFNFMCQMENYHVNFIKGVLIFF